VAAIVHCGDVGGAECVRLLAAAGPTVYMVAGNVDRQIAELEELAEGLSIQFASEVVELPLGQGRFLAVTHGDDEKTLGELIHEPRFAYVCHGHTHHPRDQRIGTARVINPGALRNARMHTVAVLDTDTDDLDHILVL
jgi:putative phosphoesterase